jgi:isopenicillin N synthase-like dioxygenase
VWTNGLYEPTAHRVINSDPTTSRVSIPFFYEPCFEAVVEPLPELVADGWGPINRTHFVLLWPEE